MKAYLTRLYLWLHGLLAEFIAGAADAFLIVGGGATVAQATIPSAESTTLRAMLAGLALAGLRRAATYLKTNPLPAVPADPAK